jgi:hypothetical protein
LAPHWQVPVAVQRLVVWGSQAVQLEPAVPQVLTERARQTLPSQQPVGHELASHTHAPARQR